MKSLIYTLSGILYANAVIWEACYGAHALKITQDSWVAFPYCVTALVVGFGGLAVFINLGGRK